MNWDAIGAIGEIVSASAVLATLIYLAVQIAQTRKMQQAESVRASRAERRDFFTSLRDSPYIPDILEKLASGDELSHSESTRLTAHHAVHWGQLYSAWIQDKLNLSGGYNTAMDTNFKYALSIPGALDWIEEYGKRLYPQEFIEDATSHAGENGD
jgi:hypothetical protein